MNPARAGLFLLLLTGCEPASLASGERLDELMGSTPAPQDPAFEVRWFAGLQSGLTIDCALVPAEIGNDEDVIWGTLSVELPEDPEPPVWLDWEDYSWALGLFVLVDRERYLPPEDSDGDDLEAWRGVWGAAGGHALLYVEGDTELAHEELLIVPDNAEDVDAIDWVELLPAVVAAQDTFVGGISARTGRLSEDEEEDLLPITSLDYLDDQGVLGVLSGDDLAGATVLDSCR